METICIEIHAKEFFFFLKLLLYEIEKCLIYVYVYFKNRLSK